MKTLEPHANEGSNATSATKAQHATSDDLPVVMMIRVRFQEDPNPTPRTRAIRMRQALKHFRRALGIDVEMLAGETDAPETKCTSSQRT